MIIIKLRPLTAEDRDTYVTSPLKMRHAYHLGCFRSRVILSRYTVMELGALGGREETV